MVNSHRKILKSGNEELKLIRVANTYNSTGLSLTVPTSVKVGDLAVAYSSTATGPSPTVYSGFTEIASINSTFEDMFQYKIMTESDLGETFTRTNDNYDVAQMIFFRPTSGSFSTVSVQDINNSGQTSGIPADQVVDEAAPCIYFFPLSCYSTTAVNTGKMLRNGQNVTSQGSNYRYIGENGNQIRFYYLINNDVSFPVTFKVDADYGSYNRLMSCAITFA